MVLHTRAIHGHVTMAGGQHCDEEIEGTAVNKFSSSPFYPLRFIPPGAAKWNHLAKNSPAERDHIDEFFGSTRDREKCPFRVEINWDMDRDSS